MMGKGPTVTILGRQNVGKSSLLNTLAGSRTAIVSSVPGTTRDRTEARLYWRGNTFTILDTGGIEEKPRSELEADVKTLALAAARESDIVLFVVDGQEGLTREDRAIARSLRSVSQPVVVVVNKIESIRHRQSVPQEVYRLGFGNVFLVSAKSGAGTGDLLDVVVKHLSRYTHAEESVPIRFVLMGKPNVGKSSLLNALLGTRRSLVSHEPHTTRDPQHGSVTVGNISLFITDTAGFRRAMKLSKQTVAPETTIERESVSRSLRALRQADVAALVLDATETISFQDRHLAEAILAAGTGACILVNKTDLLDRSSRRWQTIQEITVRRALPFLSWAPILFVSAKGGAGVRRLPTMIQSIAHNRRQRIPDEQLKHFLAETFMKKRPPVGSNGKRLRFLRLTQPRTGPPQFRLDVTGKHKPPSAYVRYIENALRKHFAFEGVPISLHAAVQKRL